MGPECFNLACIVGISYAEPLNTEAFDLFKIPLTVSERAGKIIGNVANCNSHNGKPGNPIISNNEWSGNNTSANLSCYKICATMRRKSISMNQWKTWTVMRKFGVKIYSILHQVEKLKAAVDHGWTKKWKHPINSANLCKVDKFKGSNRSPMERLFLTNILTKSYKFCKIILSLQIRRQH